MCQNLIEGTGLKCSKSVTIIKRPLRKKNFRLPDKSVHNKKIMIIHIIPNSSFVTLPPHVSIQFHK